MDIMVSTTFSLVSHMHLCTWFRTCQSRCESIGAWKALICYQIIQVFSVLISATVMLKHYKPRDLTISGLCRFYYRTEYESMRAILSLNTISNRLIAARYGREILRRVPLSMVNHHSFFSAFSTTESTLSLVNVDICLQVQCPVAWTTILQKMERLHLHDSRWQWMNTNPSPSVAAVCFIPISRFCHRSSFWDWDIEGVVAIVRERLMFF